MRTLSFSETAEFFGITERTLTQWTIAGKIESLFPEGSFERRFTVKEINSVMRGMSQDELTTARNVR